MNFKDTNNNLHFLDDASFIHLLPSDCVEITDEEAEAIRVSQIPVETLVEQFEDVRYALQVEIDIKAKSFGFSGGNALMLYAGFISPFQSLAQTFATWESLVWVEAGAYKDLVIAGTQPMLSPSEAVALMPTYPI